MIRRREQARYRRGRRAIRIGDKLAVAARAQRIPADLILLLKIKTDR
jgi:hypothetical protein